LDIEERGEDIDDWIVDDDGYADLDEDKGRGGGVVPTKAQPAFGPGSTVMKNKKRYLGESLFSFYSFFSFSSLEDALGAGMERSERPMADNSFQHDWSCRRYRSRDSSSDYCRIPR